MDNIVSKYEAAYLELIVTVSFLWMVFSYIPFFGPYKDWILLIEILLFTPYFFTNKNYIKLLGMNRFYLLLLGCSVLSIFVTNSLTNWTVWETVLFSGIFYLLSIYPSEKIKKNIIRNFFIITNIVTMLSLIAYWLILFTDVENSSNYTIAYSFGNVFQGQRLVGLMASPNILGPVAFVACLFSFFYIYNANGNKKKIIVNLILIILNLYICYLTKCRSALVGAAVVIYLLFLFSIPFKNRKVWFVVFISVGIVLGIVLVLSLPLLSKLTNRDWVTGSGRTPIYKQVIYLSTQVKPLLGFGSKSHINDLSLSYDYILHDFSGAHNMYLEIAILFGIPAMLFYIAALISVIVNVIKCFFNDANMYKTNILLPFSILTFLIVFELFEHHGLFRLSPIIGFFLLSFFLTDYYTKAALSAER